MNTENQKNNHTAEKLASREDRFTAATIDGIILIVIFTIFYFSFEWLGWFEPLRSSENTPPLLLAFFFSFLFMILFFLINSVDLIRSGQTLGKRLVGIKIVSDSDEKARFFRHILLRYFIYMYPYNFQIIGQIFGTVNVLFIFRENKKCLHDSMAKTKVIYANRVSAGVSPALPTTPCVRVRTGRFI